MQILVATCLALVSPQEQLFPNPSLPPTGQMFGAADLTGDGIPDVYGQARISVSDGNFGEASAFKYPGGLSAVDALHGDYDGDGDFDLVMGRGPLSLMRFHPPSGTFLYTEFSGFSSHYNLSLGDIDSDGKLDFVSTAWESTLVRALLGNGVAGYTGAFLSELGLESREHRLGDVNQDGELDFVGSVIEGGFAIALGGGDGTFAVPLQLAPVIAFKELALADFDADGLLDLASAAGDSGYLWPGDGAGGFLTPTVVGGIGPFTASPFGPPFDGAHVQAFDMDGSGTLDMVLAGQELGVFSKLVALYGDGAGGFTGTQQFPLGSYGQHFAFGDFDTDGDDDLALNSVVGISGCTVFFERVGDDLVAPEPVATNPEDAFGALWSFLALGDLDGDGDSDLAAGGHSLIGGGTCTLGINDGTGGFTLSGAPPLSVTPGSARVTDLAGDGVPDLVIFPSVGIPLAPPTILSIHTSDGQGGFLPEVLETLEHGAVWTMNGYSSHELADWTGDGRPDLWMPEGGIQLFPGETTPSFAPPIFSGIPGGFQLKYAKPSPVDLNLDGDLDVVLSKTVGVEVQLQTMLGDGEGSFTPLQSFPLEPVSQYDHSTAGDFDLDGWVDALTSATNFFHGIGGGLLEEQGELFDVDLEALDTADLNGDGALDVLAQDGRVLLGGPGGLSAPRGFYRPQTPLVAAGDVDGGGADLFALDVSGLVLLRGSSACAGSFEAYGGGCLGSTGSVPTLTGSGCPAPGSAFFLDVAQGLPGTVAYASFGLGKGSVPLPNGCTLLMSPWLQIFVPLHLDGAGTGSVGIAVSPISPVDVTLTAQVGLFDPSAPGLFTLTNGLAITVK